MCLGCDLEFLLEKSLSVKVLINKDNFEIVGEFLVRWEGTCVVRLILIIWFGIFVEKVVIGESAYK